MTIWATRERTERILTVRSTDKFLDPLEARLFAEKWISERRDGWEVDSVRRVDPRTMDVVLRRAGEGAWRKQGSR